MGYLKLCGWLLVFAVGALKGQTKEHLLNDLQVLSHDSLEGREFGTVAANRAARYIERRWVDQDFSVQKQTFKEAEKEGANLWVEIPGRTHTDQVIVVTAHYDHLGIRAGNIFNGADDNASGTAALFYLSNYFQQNQPAHTLRLVALDGEESGLLGAKAYVKKYASNVVLNINLDMISRNERDEIYVCGTFHFPSLKLALETVKVPPGVKMLFGHDQPNDEFQDWTKSSDHGVFYEAGLPFIYFGVEDHMDYHQPTDTYEKIMPDFYWAAVRLIRRGITVMDGLHFPLNAY